MGDQLRISFGKASLALLEGLSHRHEYRALSQRAYGMRQIFGAIREAGTDAFPVEALAFGLLPLGSVDG
jgi:hypothetical protein